jgi:segregation and condensation protein A
MQYRVDLDCFRGPLDLLLYLVRREELDIFDIPIARVTQQYLEYLELLQLVDVDVAGDFLVMAATLMEIKSRTLLPRTEDFGGGEEDPRQQLVRQLLEYRKFRDAAEALGELVQQQARTFSRIPAEGRALGIEPQHEPIRDVELWDVVSAFGRLMRQTLAMAPRSIVYDETPIEVHMAEILAVLNGHRQVRFWDLFGTTPDRGRIVGRFLAVLELIRSGRVRVEQRELFGDIWIELLPAEMEHTRTSSLLEE